MPVEIYEDTLEIECESLLAQPIATNGPLPECWPLPRLARSGNRRLMTLRTIVLSNDWVQVTICPDLGGRIVALRDRRSQTDIIPLPHDLELRDGGPRGIWSPHGIQWIAGETIRPGGLGQVEDQIHEPEDDESPGAVLLFELIPGTRLSWHGAITLHPDRADVVVEMSLYNRSLLPQQTDCGLLFGGAEGLLGGRAIRTGHHFGLIWFGETDFAEISRQDTQVAAHLRPAPQRMIPPRGTESWRVHLVPYSGLETIEAASREAVASRQGDQLFIQPAIRAKEATIEIRAAFESIAGSVDLTPQSRLAIPLAENTQSAQVLVEGEPILEWTGAAWAEGDHIQAGHGSPSALASALLHPPLGSAEADLMEQMKMVERGEYTALSQVGLLEAAICAAQAILSPEPRQQAHSAGRAVELNPTDTLSWWLRAAALKRGKQPEGDDLMQAHALAPLEPMLRAESFLGQDETLLKEPSPLLRPLAFAPDLLLECVHTLLLNHRPRDAARLLDEAIRHLDTIMYRVMMAWLHETESNLKAEAAHHLTAAANLPLNPPFPWRPLEIRAVRELAAAHPSYSFLQDWAKLGT